jgi:hypothetical protein
MRYFLIFVLMLSVVGSWMGCSYSNNYKNYQDYHDHDDQPPPKSQQTTKNR